MKFQNNRIITVFLILAIQFGGYSQTDQHGLQWFNEGNQQVKKNPSKAYSLFVKSMQFSKQHKDWDLYVRSANALARITWRDLIEKRREAFGWTLEALELVEDIEEDSAIAELHFNVARFYNFNGETEIPVTHYKKAIAIWTSLKGHDTRFVADGFSDLGDVYKYNKFDFHEAEECYETALSIREKIDFKDAEDIVSLYRNYYSLAATNRSQRDYEKALSYGSKALNMAVAMDLKDSLAMERLIATYGMVANIHRDMRESRLAIPYYLKALSLTKSLTSRAVYFTNLGETYKNDSAYDQALQYFLKAYPIYASAEMDNKNLFVNLLYQMAGTYSLQNDEQNFFSVVNQNFKQLRVLDKQKSKEAYALNVLVGEYYQNEGNYDSSLLYFQKALIAAIPSFDSNILKDNPTEDMIGLNYYIYDGLAKKSSGLSAKYRRGGDAAYLKQSLQCLELAEKLLSLARNSLDMENAKWEFLDANYDLYENILATLFEGAGDLPSDTVYSKAYRFFELSKARSLADALAQTEQNQQVSKDDSLFRLHAELRRRLAHTQDLIRQVLDRGGSENDVSILRDELVNFDRNMRECKTAIEGHYPGYFKVKYNYHVPDLTDVREIALESKLVILEYFWGKDWVYGLGINGSDIRFVRVGRPDSIKTVINRVLGHLVDEHSSTDEETFRRFAINAYTLSEIIIGPFKSLLNDGDRLQIIPDGSIGLVPFEILVEEAATFDQVNYRALKYLIKSHPIGYAYSMAVMHNKTAVLHHSPSILAVGFTGGQRLRSADTDLEEIAGAELELEALAKRFANGRFLLGKEATEANFKSLSPQFDIIHLAIHGKGDVEKNFSASLFFRAKYDSLDDGELHSYELYGLKLKAILAVLSACESGLGMGYKGEGMISMASAFTYSGCENILMSLWKVNDQASTVLMDEFYAQLMRGERIDDALRNAKLRYIENSDEISSDPKIWASLVAYGSLDRVFNHDKYTIYFLGGAGFIVLIALYLLARKYFL